MRENSCEHRRAKKGPFFSSVAMALCTAFLVVAADFVVTAELLENTNARWSWRSSAPGGEGLYPVLYPFLVAPMVSARGEPELGIELHTNGMLIVERKSNLTDSSWMSYTQFLVSSGMVVRLRDTNYFDKSIFYRTRIGP